LEKQDLQLGEVSGELEKHPNPENTMRTNQYNEYQRCRSNYLYRENLGTM
jgi:hypothetical protein